MTALVPPSLSRYIGTAYVDGRAINVSTNDVWYRYLTQALLQRVGGSEGLSTTELEALIDAAQADADAAAVAAAAAQATADAALASAGANSVAVVVDFGATFTDKAQTVVTGQAWVAAGSEIVANVLTPASTDPDELRLLDLRVVVSDIVAGVGFTVTAYSETEARGSYTVACIGV